MKIAFINPPFLPKFSRGQRSPGVTKGGTFYYPYWLCLSAGWVEKHGFQIKIFDCVAGKDNPETAISKIKKFSPQLVVMETSTPSIFSDVKFAEKVKKALSKTFLLLVGTHPTALPKETLKLSQAVDTIAVGEYDQTVLEVAQALSRLRHPDPPKGGEGFYWDSSPALRDQNDNKRVDSALEKVVGLCFRKGKRVIMTKPRAFLNNLDDFPFVCQVYKKHLKIGNYYFAAANYPMVMIITGRGCPFGCHFCLWPQTLYGLNYRFRSPENVVAEFEWIKINLPKVIEVLIEDDTFTANIERVRKICQLLIKAGNKLPWSTNTRVALDLATMKLMKKAGCRLLIVGYESGSQKVLDAMDKKIKLKDSLKFAQNAKKAGLLVHGCFMIGNPGETKETAMKTLEFAKKLDPDSAQFYPLFVYPGTRAFEWAEKKGYLKEEDFRQWLKKSGEYNCVIDLPGFSGQEILKFCNQAYIKFYLRPSYLLKKAFQALTNWQEGKRSIRNGLRFLYSIRDRTRTIRD